MSGGLTRRDLRAMNSDIELVAWGPQATRCIDRAARWLAAYEERFSRFRVLSELSRLNAGAGAPVRVSPAMLRLVQLALRFAQGSGGLFDPTVLRDLESAGYDRSFEELAPSANGGGRPVRIRWQDVVIDEAARTITVPRGGGIDLGGIGKGWAVDRMASILGRPCLVNGGGDVFAGDKPPGETGWRVGIASPFQPDEDLCVLEVTDRGVATSSSFKRSWRSGDTVMHHLIDPRGGRPSASDAVQVTAVASSAVLADFHAKVALLHGAAPGLSYLDREAGVEGIVVRKDGAVLETSGLAGLRR